MGSLKAILLTASIFTFSTRGFPQEVYLGFTSGFNIASSYLFTDFKYRTLVANYLYESYDFEELGFSETDFANNFEPLLGPVTTNLETLGPRPFFGLEAEIIFSDYFSLKPELHFAKRGTNFSFDFDQDNYEGQERLSVLSAPVFVKIKPFRAGTARVFFEGGLTVNFIMKANRSFEYVTPDPNDPLANIILFGLPSLLSQFASYDPSSDVFVFPDKSHDVTESYKNTAIGYGWGFGLDKHEGVGYAVGIRVYYLPNNFYDSQALWDPGDKLTNIVMQVTFAIGIGLSKAEAEDGN